MAATIPVTFFAPAKREPIEIVQRQANRVSQTPSVGTFLNASLNYVFVLNNRRQIIMASDNVLDLVPDRTLEQIVGLRPGEALGCIHAFECPSGCGTSQFCHLCGAVKVILAGLAGTRHMQECRLTRRVNGREASLELQVLATPLVCEHERYTLLAVANVGRQGQTSTSTLP
jgi:hypothetical protein